MAPPVDYQHTVRHNLQCGHAMSTGANFKCDIQKCFAPGLAACATQQAMTVASGAVANPSPKYRNAIAVRAALEGTLAANGYLAQSGTPKFYLDAEIRNLDQPLIGLDLEVTADVTYKVSGAGAAAAYPIKTKGSATFSRLADCRRPHAHRQRARDAREHRAVSSGTAVKLKSDLQ
jgi:hypothetical protein